MDPAWSEYEAAIGERVRLTSELDRNPDVLKDSAWIERFGRSVERMGKAEREVIDQMVTSGKLDPTDFYKSR